MPPELREMMQRYCQLGRLLPRPGELDVADPHARAEAEVVLAEMRLVKSRIDNFLATAARRRAKPHPPTTPARARNE
jgi:hypothetical protein